MNGPKVIDFTKYGLPSSELSKIAQRYGTTAPVLREDARYDLYDTLTYPAAGATQLNFFAQTLAAAGGLETTNMRQASSLSSEAMLIDQISFELMADSAIGADQFDGTDATTWWTEMTAGIAQAGYASWTVDNKVIWDQQMPFLFAPGGVSRGYGLNGYSVLDQPVAVQLPAYRNIAPLSPPVFIGELTPFGVQISWPSGVMAQRAHPTSTARMRVRLIGSRYTLAQ